MKGLDMDIISDWASNMPQTTFPGLLCSASLFLWEKKKKKKQFLLGILYFKNLCYISKDNFPFFFLQTLLLFSVLSFPIIYFSC